MSTVISKPIVCPELVGRQAALDGLTGLLSAAGERGRIALVSGEAGIGKSRLLAELCRTAEAAGQRVMKFRFFEQDAEVPYSAIARAIHELERDPSIAHYLAGVAGDLAVIEPGLAPGAVDGETPGEPDSERDKNRVHAALVAFVSALAQERPTLLAFEDLHWADTGSTEALLQVAREAPPGLVMVFTYRSDEIGAALSAMLAGLDRERSVSEVSLGRLNMTEVDRMLRAILGGTGHPRADLLHAVHQLTDGNPFFVEEVLRSLVDQAGSVESVETLRIADFDVPRSVNEAVRRRTEGLSDEARAVLLLAGVAGTRFDFPLLQEVSGKDEASLLELVKELVSAQLLAEEGDDRFVFRHALTRQAVCASLLARERHALNRRIGEAIERMHADDLDSRVEDLSWHFYEAGDWERALRYGRMAGERALSLYAAAAALEHLRRAIDAASHLHEVDTASLFLLRAAAQDSLGDFDAARQDYERAAVEAEARGDARTRWKALLELGLLWASRDYNRAGEYYREALELARGLDDARAEAQSLNRLGNWHSNAGDSAEARRLSEEALGVFRDAGDEAGVAQTLDLLGMTCYQGGDLQAGVSYYRRALPLLEAAGDLRTLASSLGSLPIASATYQTDVYPAALSPQEGREFGERAIEIARRTGWRSAEAYALWQTAFCIAPAGDYGKALEYSKEALEIARQIGHTQWQVGALCSLGATLTSILSPEEALDSLEQAFALSRGLSSDIWMNDSALVLCEAYIDLRRVAEAAALHASIPAVEAGRARTLGERWYHTGALLVELARGEYAAALERAEMLESALVEGAGRTIMRIARLKGLALVGMGRNVEGVQCLTASLVEAQGHGNVNLAWRLRADLARAYMSAGDRETARDHAVRSTALVERLAPNIPDESLRARFVERAFEQLPAPLRRRSRDHIDALTAREAEIAGLIARGLTNREIADELVLSARTVETHVANAMSKMGFASRSQLAAWAVEHGLTS